MTRKTARTRAGPLRCSEGAPPLIQHGVRAPRYGYITSIDEKCRSVPELFERFVADPNLLKAVTMKKEVQFDFRALHSMVYGRADAIRTPRQKPRLHLPPWRL